MMPNARGRPRGRPPRRGRTQTLNRVSANTRRYAAESEQQRQERLEKDRLAQQNRRQNRLHAHQQQLLHNNWVMDMQANTEIPSREDHEPWIYAFSSNEISVDYEKVGKWLLFFNNVHRSDVTGLTQHDCTWQFIKKLVENGLLYRAKCSTALKGVCEAYDKRQNGVICCYTPDYTDKQDVKRAADEIRKVVHCPNLLYKTDNDTWAGKYKHNGNSNVCIYKHTPKGELYERDTVFKNRWNLVNL